MKANIEFRNDRFFAHLLDGSSLSDDSARGLATQLLQTGVSPDDVSWDVWTLANKFKDVMQATEKSNEVWAKTAEFELHIRMGVPK
jgi:hypothetical protein